MSAADTFHELFMVISPVTSWDFMKWWKYGEKWHMNFTTLMNFQQNHEIFDFSCFSSLFSIFSSISSFTSSLLVSSVHLLRKNSFFNLKNKWWKSYEKCHEMWNNVSAVNAFHDLSWEFHGSFTSCFMKWWKKASWNSWLWWNFTKVMNFVTFILSFLW